MTEVATGGEGAVKPHELRAFLAPKQLSALAYFDNLGKSAKLVAV
jgi:hypothetical protein